MKVEIVIERGETGWRSYTITCGDQVDESRPFGDDADLTDQILNHVRRMIEDASRSGGLPRPN